MSGNVIEIPQSKRLAPIWIQQLRVAAYCRVSTDHKEQQNSLKNQIEFYTEYIQQNPYWRFVAVYYDTASDLQRNHRPGYQQLLKDCRRKRIDLILVKSLSRFGRDTVETIKQIRRLKHMDIGVYIETGGINTYVDKNVKLQEDHLETIVMLGEQVDLSEKIKVAKEEGNAAKTLLDAQERVCSEYNDRQNIKCPQYYLLKLRWALQGDDGWAGRDKEIRNGRQNTAVRDDTYKQFLNITPSKPRSEILRGYSKIWKQLGRERLL